VVAEAEAAPALEEEKPTKRVVKRRAKAVPSAKSGGKKVEETSPEKVADTSAEAEPAENQGDNNATT